MLRFGRWSISLDQWLETLASSFAQTDGMTRVPTLNLPISSESLLTADSPTPPPVHDDSIAVTPLGTAAAPLAAETPVIWLLPEAETAAPRADDDSTESSATASFVTLAGGHIDFVSTQPAFGLGGGLFIDADTRTILTDAQVSRLGLGSGDDDQLVLGGGSDGDPLAQHAGVLTEGVNGSAMDLGGFGGMFERVVLLAGSNYNLAVGNAGAGHVLTISGEALGAANHLIFDGSGEKSGRFVISGGAGDDSLIAGHGADVLNGGGGADLLTGGAGADRFVYFSAAESTGAHHDTLLDFTFGEDVIDLPVTVQGLDAAVTKGALSQSSFDADLSAALGGGVLEAGHALFFTPDSGGLAGHHFLVVDGNGEAGYQPGVDFVIELPTLPPADFHGTGFLV